jgi:hypothetical protein
MSISKSRPRSAAQGATSRANGRKSAGPKTLAGKRRASLNALKHGRTAQAATRPLWQAMADLGEDPARFRSLLRDVLNSYAPQSPIELRLCEDITRLMLKLERIQQAQEARVVRAYQKLESSRAKRLREMEGSASYDALQTEVLEAGLRRAPDSPAKFSEAAACLERLRARVESGDFSGEAELNALYGKQPTFRGAGIINTFRDLGENPADRDLAASLHLMIIEEMRDLAAESEVYYREHVEISRAMRLECLAPAADREYLQLHRQGGDLERQLERKIKLLLSLQASGRRTAGDGSQDSEGVAGEPVAWLVMAAQPAKETAASAGKAADPAVASQPPADTPAVRGIALKHKIETPRRFGPTDREKHEEMIRRINEVYGIADSESKPVAAKPAFQVSGSEKARQDSAGSQGEGARLESSGKGLGNGETEQK